MSSIWGFAFQCIIAAAQDGAPAGEFMIGDGLPVPAGVHVFVESDRKEYFLGENVLLHLGVENVGAAPFDIQRGGDYRGAPRELRFQVRAVDAEGKECVDPSPFASSLFMGGIMITSSIEPNTTSYMSVALLDYRRIDRPGTYRIFVSHDLGWLGTPTNPVPVAEITLSFKRPSAAEAEQLVAQMVKDAKQEREWMFDGKKAKPYPAFSLLRDPIYLPVLLKLVAEKSKHAIEGVSGISTPAATEALIRAANDDDPEFALLAAKRLIGRLPPPPPPDLKSDELLDELFRESRESQQKYVAEVWRPEFAPDVRRVADKFQASLNQEIVAWGTDLRQRVDPKPPPGKRSPNGN